MLSAGELTETRGCWCLAARRTARKLTRLYEKHLRPHGLRATQFTILASLGIRGATPVGELAHRLDLERTTVTRSAALLERNGWVRSVAAKDAREHPLELTPAGRQKLEAALPAWKAAQVIASRELQPSAITPVPPSTAILPAIARIAEPRSRGVGGVAEG